MAGRAKPGLPVFRHCLLCTFAAVSKLISIHPDNPQESRIKEVVEVMRKGGVVIYPTDTVYGMGCDMFNSKALERVYQLKGIKPGKSNFSIICSNLSNIAEYAKLSNPAFKLMKRALPGPFTFVLPATHKIPKLLEVKKKTIGIRVPDHAIPRALVDALGNPIITTSLQEQDEGIEYSTDPELIFERMQKLVDLVIDGGIGQHIPSTIVDYTDEEPQIIREGLGNLDDYL
jgi:tRNA threonylcarbamoyl adenosine modification protein (Sua5/YciO/YrdC/YwlC family)